MSSDDEDDEFLFESAHLALRSNADYLKLMRHLACLCAQRIKIHRDIEALRSARQRANEDPLSFIGGLDSIDLPSRSSIPNIPDLDFNCEAPNLQNDVEKSFELSTNFWTDDEQRKLEKLLHEFPPEAVESQRFAKISKAMGTRTPKQIASRVQKFFKKLNEANLPIPGSSYTKSRGGRRKPARNNLKLDRPTTFFPERNISSDLLMNDSDNEAELIASKPEPSTSKQDEGQTLRLLKEVREVKSKAHSDQEKLSGSVCCECNDELFLERAWHCKDCVRSDYCSDCLTTNLIEYKFKHLNHDVMLYLPISKKVTK